MAAPRPQVALRPHGLMRLGGVPGVPRPSGPSSPSGPRPISPRPSSPSGPTSPPRTPLRRRQSAQRWTSAEGCVCDLPLSLSSSFRDCGQTAPRVRLSKRLRSEGPCGWSRVGFVSRCRYAPLPDSPPSTPTPTGHAPTVPAIRLPTAGTRRPYASLSRNSTPTIPLDGTMHL